MEYRKFGPTGLKVSALGFGTQMYMYGVPVPEGTEELTLETVKKALEMGVNYFDCAEFYGAGKMETFLGNAFKKLGTRREDVVVSTKIFLGSVGGANAVGASRKRLIEGTHASLKRLQMEYVDVLYVARYDYETPLEETCRAMNTLVNQGKVLYWGTSEWSAKQLVAAIELCNKLNLARPIAEQAQYNMIHRDKFETEFAEVFDDYGLGTSIWSPLAGGLLTGKYLKEEKVSGRMDYINPGFKEHAYGFSKWFGPEKIEGTKKMFKEFEEIATSLGGTVPQLAIAWILGNKDVSTIICAFSKLSQVEENLKAMEMFKKITPEIYERIEKLLGNKPVGNLDYKAFKPRPARR
jgi:voltage-dependent potassium channel beta subunit